MEFVSTLYIIIKLHCYLICTRLWLSFRNLNSIIQLERFSKEKLTCQIHFVSIQGWLLLYIWLSLFWTILFYLSIEAWIIQWKLYSKLHSLHGVWNIPISSSIYKSSGEDIVYFQYSKHIFTIDLAINYELNAKDTKFEENYINILIYRKKSMKPRKYPLNAKNNTYEIS